MKEPNVWRTIVITVGGIIALVFLWMFWQRASSDLQALFVGIGFGTLIGIPLGLMMRPRPHDDAGAYTQGYMHGHGAGVHEGYSAALAQDTVCEVVVPTQARELVPVQPAHV